eukprot:TRINITY_DN6175_c0_g1_i1.p1 TRINITY_DN6175_c0_g1~~TRINITY_DN6175_c0_g1_i1.p1  ORF type:complete len:184 (+),score=44.34 TRINITY_DN6175_c0_g1_i1:249-800(+)
MDRFLRYGRRMWLMCKIFFGVEERNIRALNIELQKRAMKLREQKALLAKGPEEMVLSEVRRLIEEMHRLNQTLDNTDKKFKELLAPLRKEANMLMEAQLESEKMLMKDMIQIMRATSNQFDPSQNFTSSKVHLKSELLEAPNEQIPQGKNLEKENENGIGDGDLVSQINKIKVEKQKNSNEGT